MQKEELHGGDIYRNKVILDYSVNVNPLGIPQEVKEAMQKAIDVCDCYPDIRSERLLNALSTYFEIPCDHFVLGNGASELLAAIVHALKPRRALVPVPSFLGYEYVLKMEHTDVTFCKKEELLSMLSEQIDVLFFTNPNNPNGELTHREELFQILEICKRNHIILILDECFMEFCLENESMISEIENYDQLLIIKAFTKIYAIPGVRLGYLVGSNVKLLEQIKEQLPEWNLSVFAQEAGVACLNQNDYLTMTKTYVSEEREFLRTNLKNLGIKEVVGCANFLLFYDERDLYRELLEKGILIRDCSNYKGLKKGYYRIAVKKHSENEFFLKCLREVICNE